MCVNQDVEGAETVEERQEGDAGSDLPNHVSDLGFDLLLVFVRRLQLLPLRVFFALYLELPPLESLLSLHVLEDYYQPLDLLELQPVLNLGQDALQELVDF